MFDSQVPAGTELKQEFIIWKQFWTGGKPRKWVTSTDRQEAKKMLDALNSSPSGEWNIYSLEVRNV